MKNLTRSFALAAVLLLTAAVSTAQNTNNSANTANSANLARGQVALDNITRFGDVLLKLNQYYIDSLDFNNLVDLAIQGVVSGLDPHTSFILAKDVESANEQLSGSFVGVGVEFAIISDTVTIQRVFPGGGAEAVGMLPGDKIVTIDGENVAGISITNDMVRGRLRGERNTKVNVEVVRRDVPGTLDFTIDRHNIAIKSIDAAYSPEPELLYIRLSQFAFDTMKEFLDAFTPYQGYPQKGLILDLRSNGGGYVNVAVNMCDMLLEKGQIITYTEGLHSKPSAQVADGRGFYIDKPVIVLVDDYTASASEIVAGALQDWDRAIIVGRRTFGKGLVQRSFSLTDGSELRMTIARYHTPSGRVIQTPYQMGHGKEYSLKNYERYASGEYFSLDSLKLPDSLRFETCRLKRPVYGGGGILPDIFVPSDTTGVTPYYSTLLRKGLLTEFANKYIDTHRPEIEADSTSFESLCSHFDEHRDETLAALAEYATKAGVEMDSAQFEQSKALICTNLKALVARSVFDTTGYWRVINAEADPVFKRAVELINDWPTDFPSL